MSDLSVVFMDTTTLHFEGQGGQTLGQLGHSKDYRPHQKQMIVSVIMDQDGRPVCSEMWPGDTADVTTLIPVIDRLRQRFAIGRVCVVADPKSAASIRESRKWGCHVVARRAVGRGMLIALPPIAHADGATSRCEWSNLKSRNTNSMDAIGGEADASRTCATSNLGQFGRQHSTTDGCFRPR